MKGVFIPEITVEMLRSASLDTIEDFFSRILSNDNEVAIFNAELPKWIPCSERLPDYHDEVLVTSCGEVAIAWLYLDGNWRSNDMPEPMFKNIVAWMPLPESYRGNKDDE